MRVFTTFSYGWQLVWKHKRAWIALYCTNVLLAFLAVIPVHTWLRTAAGHSTIFNESAGKFDFTVIGDLVRNHDGVMSLVSNAAWLAMVHWLVSVLIIGGALHLFIHVREKTGYLEILKGGMHYFWRLCRLMLYVLIAFAAVIALAYAIVRAIGVNPMEMKNDVVMVRTFKIIAGVACWRGGRASLPTMRAMRSRAACWASSPRKRRRCSAQCGLPHSLQNRSSTSASSE